MWILLLAYLIGGFLIVKYVEYPTFSRSQISYWVAYGAAWMCIPIWLPPVIFIFLKLKIKFKNQ